MTLENLDKELCFAEWYTSHKVFERLSAIKDFYETIDMTSSGCVEMPLTNNVGRTYCVLFPSIKGTIDSISILLRHGHCNDAFALIRKYNDAIYLDIYKSILINETYEQLFEDDNVSWNIIVKNKVCQWINSESPLKERNTIDDFVKVNTTFKKIIEILEIDSKDKKSLYKKLRNSCNENMHYNSFQEFQWNDPDFLKRNKEKTLIKLNNLYRNVTFLSSLHFALLYELHPEYFMAYNRVVEEQPALDSEYWVASGLQDFFNKVVYPFNNKLGEYLISLGTMNLKYDKEQDK